MEYWVNRDLIQQVCEFRDPTHSAAIPEHKERVKVAFGEILIEMRQKVVLEYRKQLHKLADSGENQVDVHK